MGIPLLVGGSQPLWCSAWRYTRKNGGASNPYDTPPGRYTPNIGRYPVHRITGLLGMRLLKAGYPIHKYIGYSARLASYRFRPPRKQLFKMDKLSARQLVFI